MIQPGFETTEPRTGTRTVVIAGAKERDGMGFTLEVTCPPGAGPSIPEHLHTGWTETFEILQGEAKYRLEGREHTASVGVPIVLPPGQPHVHPWNVGTDVLVYRQSDDFSVRSATAVDEVLGVFATLNGLALEGKVNARGVPKNPLQFAATLRTLVRHEGFDAAVPIPVQRVLGGSLGRVAEMLGYRAVYPRFVGEGDR